MYHTTQLPSLGTKQCLCVSLRKKKVLFMMKTSTIQFYFFLQRLDREGLLCKPNKCTLVYSTVHTCT
ncbi:hypothetical protein FKM82_010288 [Ascaphus truei]